MELDAKTMALFGISAEALVFLHHRVSLAR